jgi:hypothetical protein
VPLKLRLQSSNWYHCWLELDELLLTDDEALIEPLRDEPDCTKYVPGLGLELVAPLNDGLEPTLRVKRQPYTVLLGGKLEPCVQLTVNVTDPPGLALVLVGLIEQL